MYEYVNGRKIHYKKFGHGRPFLLVHGWGGSLYSLMDLAKLAAPFYTTYVIDLPGFGKSDPPPGHWGVEGFAETINSFCIKCKIVKPIYFGHSFGGALGVYLASKYPNFIGTLILCSASYKREMRMTFLAKILKYLPQPNINNQFVNQLLFIFKRLYYKLLVRNSELMKYPHLEANFKKLITQDLTAETKTIKIPTQIIWGENDRITPVIMAYALSRNINGSILNIIPDCTHSLPLKEPGLVWGKMKPFLSDAA